MGQLRTEEVTFDWSIDPCGKTGFGKELPNHTIEADLQRRCDDSSLAAGEDACQLLKRLTEDSLRAFGLAPPWWVEQVEQDLSRSSLIIRISDML